MKADVTDARRLHSSGTVQSDLDTSGSPAAFDADGTAESIADGCTLTSQLFRVRERRSEVCSRFQSEVRVTIKIAPFTMLLAAVTLVTGLPVLTFSQTTGRANPALVISSMAGRDLFDFYCASCHGRDGKGGGHAAAALKVAPADLAALTQRNHGTFPTARLEAIIKGEERLSTPAHGSSEMPVWGPIFRALDSREAINAARIEHIVNYVESLQAGAKALPPRP